MSNNSSTPSLPKVAIVILNFNGRHYLEKYLPSVLNSQYPNLELYVADNGSTDDSIEYLQQQGFELFIPSPQQPTPPPSPTGLRIPKYLIRMSENHGFAGGYNLALTQITHCPYFILLNSDVEVSPDWIDPIIEKMEKDPQIGAVQPKVLMESEKTLFEHAGAAGGWIDKWGYPFCRGRIFNDVEQDQQQYDEEAEIFWASGAAMFIRAPLFKDLGGFDADFFAHMEEIDLCWRIKRANYKILCYPKSRVWHVGGGTLPKSNPRKDYLNFRNSLTTLLKNKKTAASAFSAIFIRLLLDGLAALLFLSKGKFGSILAIIKAHWTFFFQIPKHWKKRKIIQQRIKATAYQQQEVFNSKGLYNKSIVWQHYAKGIKKFSNLKH